LVIQINGERIDFALEGEKTLGEVVRGLQAWMDGRQLVLTSLSLDEQELLDRPEASWQGIPVREVGTLCLGVKQATEVGCANLETAGEYLDLMQQALQERDAGLLEQLLRDFPLLTESLSRNPAFPEAAGDLLARLDRQVRGRPAGELLGGQLQETGAILGDLRRSVGDLLLEAQDPPAALRRAAGELERTIRELGEVSLLLQTGKDRQAMESIVRFSDLFRRLIRIFSRLQERGQMDLERLEVEGKDLKAFTTELNGILRELVQAFQNQDSVLLGDLLEYEVAPRLDGLRRFVEGRLVQGWDIQGMP
jgi:hypothetical protein